MPGCSPLAQVSKEFLNYLLEQGTVKGAEIDVSSDVNATTMGLVDVYQGCVGS